VSRTRTGSWRRSGSGSPVVDNDAFRYVCELLEGLQAVREGRWEQAERMAERCLATGLEVGDRDAHAYHGAQLLSIRWRQGREFELQQSVDGLVISPTVADGSIGFVAAQAANAISLLLTAVANTAVNRRVTFGIRGRADAARHQVRGLIAFGIGLALTSGALAALHASVPQASRTAELTVLVAANLTATLMRFGLYRSWVFRAAQGDVR